MSKGNCRLEKGECLTFVHMYERPLQLLHHSLHEALHASFLRHISSRRSNVCWGDLTHPRGREAHFLSLLSLFAGKAGSHLTINTPLGSSAEEASRAGWWRRGGASGTTFTMIHAAVVTATSSADGGKRKYWFKVYPHLCGKGLFT